VRSTGRHGWPRSHIRTHLSFPFRRAHFEAMDEGTSRFVVGSDVEVDGARFLGRGYEGAASFDSIVIALAPIFCHGTALESTQAWPSCLVRHLLFLPGPGWPCIVPPCTSSVPSGHWVLLAHNDRILPRPFDVTSARFHHSIAIQHNCGCRVLACRLCGGARPR
jgi:hypothetical protein